MRHHNANRKLKRERNQRRALLRSLARELFLRGKITTTEAKAKEVRPFAEKLITNAKGATLAARRLVAGRMSNNIIVGKLVDVIAKKYEDRKGGYIRIIKMNRRPSDGSKMAVVELV
ncbi:MAG: 50S ribosomal protein L17 [bacterium]